MNGRMNEWRDYLLIGAIFFGTVAIFSCALEANKQDTGRSVIPIGMAFFI
ncbi:hypothetical protein M1I95_18340 [Rossellomorea marisflavi]|nr:hypothetical protein [Rossellomorea marisflavi]UTE72199.1 hypothetical protein M1I95_18340 [Rossellomorea marisflavi]